MLERLIGIIAMIFGFIGLIIENYGGAFCCFGFAFILWCVMTVGEYIDSKKKQKKADKESDVTVAYVCDQEYCRHCDTGGDRYCYHTFDINHAKNFVRIGDGWYEEKLNKTEE